MSIIFESVRRVMDLFAPSTPVLSYSEQFEALWKLDAEGLKELAPNGVICLLWDKTPFPKADAVHIANYLSPIDWAVAMSAKHAGQTLPTKVILLDGGFESAGPAAKFIGDVLAGGHRPMPWFHCVRLTAPDAALTIARALATPHAAIDAEQAGHLKSVAVGWITQPASAGDRHALANLVGPRLLLGDFASVSPGLTALTSLLAALELFPSETKGRDVRKDLAWFPPDQWKPHIDDFWLVDDLANAGWADFLKSALQIHTDDQLKIHTSPNALIDLLSSDLEMVRLGKGLPGSDWDKRVLVLDLRLFGSGTGEGVAAERDMFTTLAGIAKAVKLDFPHLDAIASGTTRQNTPQYHAALALLPCLLSKADPFLPIVVFSSTRQRGVTECLSHYSSTVILDLDKPTLDGRTHADVVDDTRKRFRRALKKAVAISRGRAACRSIRRRACAPSRIAGVEAAHLHARRKEWKVAHVFLEESGDIGQGNSRRTSFVVGGLVVLLPSTEHILHLRTALAKRGLVWGLAEGFPPTPNRPDEELPTQPLKKMPKANEQDAVYGAWLDGTREAIAEVCGSMFLIGLEAEHNDSDLTGPDSLYREMSAQTLDLLLTSVMPHYLSGSVDVWMHMATRSSPHWPVDPATGATLSPTDANTRFGLEQNYNTPGLTFYSFGEASAYPLVQEVWNRARRQHSWRLTAARGVRLTDFEHRSFRKRSSYLETLNRKSPPLQPTPADKEKARKTQKEADGYVAFISRTPRPEQIHFVADFVARLARGELTGKNRAGFYPGFLATRSDATKCLGWWEAYRRGGAEEGILKIIKTIESEGAGGTDRFEDLSVSRWVLADAAEWVETLSRERRRFGALINRLKNS